MAKDVKKYVLTKDCFVGKVGDVVEIDWNGMDGANWENLNQNTCGCPFCEMDSIREFVEPEKKMGKIVLKQRGLIQTYECTCGAHACEADEGGYYCISAPEYGLNGCGAVLMRHEE